jgi:glycosyltransferase involved in cell wall biosynthesis
MPRTNTFLLRKLRRDIGETEVVIGVSARLSAEKGIEYLLGAIPLLRKIIGRFKIVIAGPLDPVGEAAYKTRIIELVKQYQKYIVFVGTIKPREMGSFYKLIDVLVLPSVNRTEAFGLVQVEAMLVGVPVVASNLPGVRVPVMKTGMGLVVPPKDSHALAQAIHTVLTHRATYVHDLGAVQDMFFPDKSFRAFSKLL